MVIKKGSRKGARKGSKKKITWARSAITGRFVKKSTAKTHPRTTVVESRRRTKKPRRKKTH